MLFPWIDSLHCHSAIDWFNFYSPKNANHLYFKTIFVGSSIWKISLDHLLTESHSTSKSQTGSRQSLPHSPPVLTAAAAPALCPHKVQWFFTLQVWPLRLCHWLSGCVARVDIPPPVAGPSDTVEPSRPAPRGPPRPACRHARTSHRNETNTNGSRAVIGCGPSRRHQPGASTDLIKEVGTFLL